MPNDILKVRLQSAEDELAAHGGYDVHCRTIDETRTALDQEGDNQRIIEFARYLEDFNSLGGGAMRARYGDEPMAGFANVIEHFRPIAQRARSALGRNAG